MPPWWETALAFLCAIAFEIALFLQGWKIIP